jgi:hypothetical protein
LSARFLYHRPWSWLLSVTESAFAPAQQGSNAVKDYRASVEKLRTDAADAALIRDLATDQTKRDMYERLHQHFNRLADEVEQAIKFGPKL